MTEIALEPVHLLAQRSMLASVALRISSGGRKFTITISKRYLTSEKSPRYIWSLDEIDAVGEILEGGTASSIGLNEGTADPVDAYWSAVDKLCEVTRT